MGVLVTVNSDDPGMMQFDIADEREPSAVAATLTRLGYEPVWKDWDPAILSN